MGYKNAKRICVRVHYRADVSHWRGEQFSGVIFQDTGGTLWQDKMRRKTLIALRSLPRQLITRVQHFEKEIPGTRWRSGSPQQFN